MSEVDQRSSCVNSGGGVDTDHVVEKKEERRSQMPFSGDFGGGHLENQAFITQFKEKFYHEVFLGKKDMLIDENNLLLLFESKLILHKFIWNYRSQSFEKIPTGVVKKNSINARADTTEKSHDNTFATKDKVGCDNYPLIQAFRNKLQEKFYNSVIIDGQDMLIDSDNRLVLFESKPVMRKLAWNQKTQSFEKIPTGVAKKAHSSHKTQDTNSRG